MSGCHVVAVWSRANHRADLRNRVGGVGVEALSCFYPWLRKCVLKRNLIVTTLAILLLGLAACGEGPGSSSSAGADSSSLSTLGGDRLPVQVPGEDYGHQPVQLTGVVALQGGGCWTIDLGDRPRLVVFPAGYTKPPDNGAIVEGPDGQTVESGMAVDADGGVVPATAFPGVPDGYWGNYLSFCNPGTQEFVVLDTLEPAFDPQALSQDDLVAMVESGDLSTDWGCGIGFAASTPDQRVALIVHLRDGSGEVDTPVTFPDERWSAEVVIGKLLMTEWCDDVTESWAPQPLVVARWPLSSGVLEFTPPPTSGCDAGPTVSATLRDATVATPGGDIALGSLSLVNDAYGCFAG